MIPSRGSWKRAEPWYPEGNEQEEEIEEVCTELFSFFGRRMFVNDGRLENQSYSEHRDAEVIRVWIPQSGAVELMMSWIGKEVLEIAFEGGSPLRRIESEAFSSSSLASIVIPRNVEILCSSCFSGCQSLSSITFESDSRLTRIESSAFSNSSLSSIVIPRKVEFIDGSSFCNVKIQSMKIEEGNAFFAVVDGFLIDRVNHKLIRNISESRDIVIWRDIEILCSSCFSFCKSLSSITFESDSRLTRIESNAFSRSSLSSIVIPRNVEILCSECFSFCESLSSITFE
jgi:hypothetical protein